MSGPKGVLDLFRLDGRVAVVTGGSKGLGKSIAVGLAEAGAMTVLVSRHADEGAAAAVEVARAGGRESVAVAADVTKADEVERMVAGVLARFGRIDVLVNSAGINIRHPIEDVSPEEFRTVLETNLTGTWLCCRAVSKVMKDAKRGSVINVGSALSWVGLAERTAYTAAKGGVLNLTRTLALEWAPWEVRCNVLCPGPFLTEMNRPLLAQPEKAAAVVGLTAFNRWGELHEIRGAAVFLASDAASYVTGAALAVDAGWTAK